MAGFFFALKLVQNERDAACYQVGGRFSGGDLDEVDGEGNAQWAENQAVGEKVHVTQDEVRAVADGVECGPVGPVGEQRVVVPVDEGDGVWQVTAKDGLAGATKQMRGRNITAMFEDSKKRVWFGTWGAGVTVFDGKEWMQHLGKEKSTIFTFAEDKAGVIWVATNAKGVFRFDGTKWTNDLAEEGGINMMEATSDGLIWISSGTIGGLRYWDGKKWVVSLESPAAMRCLLETKDKQLWAGGILDGIHIKK